MTQLYNWLMAVAHLLLWLYIMDFTAWRGCIITYILSTTILPSQMMRSCFWNTMQVGTHDFFDQHSRRKLCLLNINRALLELVKTVPHVQCWHNANHDALDSRVSEKGLAKAHFLVSNDYNRSALPIAKVDGGSHSCVNWDRIDEWAEKRTFVPSGDNMKHPIYGKFSFL